jgi:chromate transport protein ChrA
MCDNNDNHGVAAVMAFPCPTYVLYLCLFALVLAPYADLLVVLKLMHVAKFARASVVMISVIKLTRKLLNSLTYASLDAKHNP